MKFVKLFFLLAVALLFVITLGSCSDVQNREKKEPKKDTGAISLKVETVSTTNGTTTTETFDKTIQALVTKSLTQVLVGSADFTKLFSETAVVSAKENFPNYKTAKENFVTVNFNYMQSEDENNEVIVATINQEIEPESGEKINRLGKIYFNRQGLVIGFDIQSAVPANSTEEKPTS